MVRSGLGEDRQGQKLKKIRGKRICENERSRNSVFRVNMFLFNCFMAIAKSIAMFPDSCIFCFLKLCGQTVLPRGRLRVLGGAVGGDLRCKIN